MASEATKINEATLLRIADVVPAMVALYNIKTGEYIFANKATTRIIGYLPEEIISGGYEFVASLVHPEDMPEIMKKNQAALDYANMNPDTKDEVTATFEYRMKHKDGKWRWVHTEGTVFSRGSDGSVECLLNVSLDISDRKDAEQRLMKSLRLLETMLHPQQ